MKRMRTWCLISVLAALAGCGGSESGTAKDQKKIVWYALMVHPYVAEVQKGVIGYERDTGISIKRQIGQAWTQDNENANVEPLAAQGYKAFSLYPADASAANGLYEELVQNGAYVVSYGAPTVLPTTASFCVATDVKQAAMEATEALIGFMGGQGNILNVLELVEDPNTILRKEGVEAAVAKYPNVQIIQEIAGMESIETSTAKIQAALSARIEEIDGVICTGYTPTVAAAIILSEWNQTPGNRRIRFVGIDTDQVVLDAIRGGDIDATISQNPYGHGYITCALLNYLLDGWRANPDHYFINSGTVLVTKDKVDTFQDDVMAITQRIMGELETKYLLPPN
jgi:ribose transport system substrate-binding protein